MAERRRKSPSGSGTQPFRRKDGRFQVGVTIDGKRRWLYGKTRVEASRKLREALNRRDAGLPVADDRRPLSELLWSWLEIVTPSVTPSTVEIYTRAIRLHLEPALGHLPLSRLSGETVEHYYADRIRAGASPTTVRGEHAVLRAVLEKAVQWELISRNPAAKASVPRLVPFEAKVLSPEDVRRFVQAAAGERYEALWLLAITTGLRQGELLALTWKDVDLDGRILTVARNYRRDGSIGETKGHKVRRIALVGLTVEALRRHRERTRSVYLFPAVTDLSRPLDHKSAYRELGRFLRENGLPSVSPHALRHSAATALMVLGVPLKVVSEILGHSTVAITANLYQHVLPTMQDDAIGALERFLTG